MTAALQTVRTDVARPLKTLVPLIQSALDRGNHAGLEHYRRVGEMLIEAREQVAHYKWSQWLTKNFTLSKFTASRYMKLAELDQSHSGAATTLTAALGEKSRDSRRHETIREVTKSVNVETLTLGPQTRDDETRLHRELALELIDIGYKALATRLHPDKGGSQSAMRRLNRVRDNLKTVAKKGDSTNDNAHHNAEKLGPSTIEYARV